MAIYIDTSCCDDCSADNPCTAKPVVTSGNASGTCGSAFSYNITATNSPTSYNATGLPAGLSVNTATGVISGTPTGAASTSVVISATNACGTGTKSITLTFSGGAPVVTSSGTATGTGCLAFSYTITGSNSPTSFGATGLPSGLSVNSSTGDITGRVRSAWSGTITVSASNGCGTGTKNVSVTIDAPSVPSPTLVCDSIEATMSKGGFQEYAGHVSSPPKYYRSCYWHDNLYSQAEYHEYSSTNGSCYPSTLDSLLHISGTSYWDYCATTLTAGNRYTVQENGTNTVDNTIDCGSASPCLQSIIDPSVFYDGSTPTVTSNTWSVTNGCTCVIGDYKKCGTMTEELQDEFTTAQLIDCTTSSLPSYPGTFAGTCSSLYDLSTDEVTFTVRRFKYKFTLPTLTGYDCYKITWLEGATAKSYLWNGTDTETPVYGPVNEPGSNGTVNISSISVSCSCS